MLTSFLISFRESLEAALIIGIMAAYLVKVGKKDMAKYIYSGTFFAIMASLAVGWLVKTVYGSLEGTMEQVFEGGAAITASVVLTYMIFWMVRNAKNIKGELQAKMDVSITKNQAIGIAVLAFIAVFREGVETVLFLSTSVIQSPIDTIIGSTIGITSVVLLSFLMFKGIYRLDLARFFRYTGIILIVFAAGLTATAVHEFNEAGIIPAVVEHVWDANPPVNPDGSYPLLHEKGLVGGTLKSLIGYNGNPSLTEIMAYLGYWLVIILAINRFYAVTYSTIPKTTEMKAN